MGTIKTTILSFTTLVFCLVGACFAVAAGTPAVDGLYFHTGQQYTGSYHVTGGSLWHTYFLFTANNNWSNTCYVSVDDGNRFAYLLGDDGSWLSPVALNGSNTTASNSRCSILGSGSSFAGDPSNKVNVTLKMSFNQMTFGSSTTVYLAAIADNSTGNSTGWVGVGNYNTTG